MPESEGSPVVNSDMSADKRSSKQDNSYNQLLQRIRSMSQQTEEQDSAKKEASHDLRFGLMEHYATIMLSALDSCKTETDLQPNQLVEKLLAENPQVDSKAIGAFVEQLFIARKHVAAIKQKHLDVQKNNYKDVNIEALKRITPAEQLESIEMLEMVLKANSFDELTPDQKDAIAQSFFVASTGKYPEWQMKFRESPLALALMVHPDDFAKVDPGEDIAGFYKAEHTDQSGLTYPFIVVNGEYESAEEILRHEEGHAVNNVLIRTLKQLDRSSIWSSGAEEAIDADKGVNLLIEGLDKVEQILEENKITDKSNSHLEAIKTVGNSELESWVKQRVFPHAFSRAKNEMIADAIATGTFDYIKHLTEFKGVYDYISQSLCGARVNYPHFVSEVFVKKIQSEYADKLTQMNDMLCEIRSEFDKHEDLNRKLPLMLAQIPTQTWDSELPILLIWAKTYPNTNTI